MAEPRIVHVVDDDAALRDSLEFLLEAAGLEVRVYETAEAILAAAPAMRSCCILTDVRMPGMTGIELLRALGERRASIPVIVMTGHGDVQLAVEAMKNGAADFIEKPFSDDVLLVAIRSAFERWAGRSKETASREVYRQRIASLSGRERDVLEGLVAGKPNKIIAFDLSISPRTVEIYRANLMTKMEANSLSELVRMALVASQHDAAP